MCFACYLHTRDHPVDECAGCGRRVAVKNQYCRLCWNQARILAREAGNRSKTACRYLREVREHQLFFADMYSIRGASTTPRPTHRGRGRPPKPAPPPASRPDTTNVQLMLFGPLIRDYARFDESTDHDADNPWLRWGRHLAHELAERRGWHRKTRETVDQGLRILLSEHAAGDVVHYATMFTGLRAQKIPVDRIADVLGEMDILADDRKPAFDQWLTTKLADLAPGIAEEAALWIRCLHDGGPRAQPRNPATAQKYANVVRPVLLDWSTNHDHLREVTRDDVLTALRQHHGAARQLLLIALRSLFRHSKKNRIVFQNPTTRIRVGSRIGKLAQPLADDQIQRAATRTTRPADRLIIALAAIHAARTKGIRELQLEDVDLGNRRLTIAGRSRPLDDLTCQLLTEWLDYRRTRWPITANPHLIVNQQTAPKLTPVSTFWIGVTCRRLDATVERLHADRQLEEALTHGPDPLHLAVVFGLDRKTAIRYADSARQLLQTAIENHTPASGPTQGTNPPIS